MTDHENTSSVDRVMINVSIGQAEVIAKALRLYTELSTGKFGMIVDLIKEGVIPNLSTYSETEGEAPHLMGKVDIFSPIKVVKTCLSKIKDALEVIVTYHATDKAVHVSGRRAYEIERMLTSRLSDYSTPDQHLTRKVSSSDAPPIIAVSHRCE